jgi:hypothetical protein
MLTHIMRRLIPDLAIRMQAYPACDISYERRLQLMNYGGCLQNYHERLILGYSKNHIQN